VNERQVALIKGDLATCRRLIVSGSSAGREIEGVPALGWAVESGSTPLVRYLLRLKGTRVDARDTAGRSPLHRLLRSNSLDLSDLSRTEIIKILLASGADPRVQDSFGQSPMLLAERYFPELLPHLQGARGEVKAAPPVRALPRAKAWPGKKSKPVYSSRDLAMWSAAAGLFSVTAAVATHPGWFRGKAPNVAQVAHATTWQSQFEAAREAMSKGDFARASSYARSALSSDRKDQSKKGSVYLLAANASLKNRDLAAMEWVFSDWGRGPSGLGL
jgi:ankyrin repeat protein